MNKKTVVLRADGNVKIGLGHIYRCIAIAEMLQENFNCEFLLGHQSQFNNVIPSKYTVKYIPENISIEQEHQWIKENYITNSLLFILDGYHFDASYQKSLISTNAKLVYIDDLCKEHMFAHAVINHSPSANSSSYKKEDHTELFLGIKYVLLRRSFLDHAKNTSIQFSETSSALISMGGSDEHNITLKMIEALVRVQKIKKINVVIGASYPFKQLLDEKIKSSQKDIHVFSNLSETEMLELMKASDIGFAPSSTTCLELIAVNKPVFIGTTASNQSEMHTFLSQHALIFDLKDLLTITSEEITGIVESNIQNTAEINKMLTLQKQIIDGRSGERIVEIIKKTI